MNKVIFFQVVFIQISKNLRCPQLEDFPLLYVAAYSSRKLAKMQWLFLSVKSKTAKRPSFRN